MTQGTAAARRWMQAGLLRWVAACLLALPVLAQAQATAAAAAAPGTQKTMLIMGDSLSAGYGMSAAQSWVGLLEQRLQREAPDWRVVNGSISGETTAGGASRIVQAVVRERPAVVVIALGANDGLRGLPLADARRNLARMIGASQHVGAQVLLVGMRMPPNLGTDYTAGFEANYRLLAETFDVPLLPFLLEPIATDRVNFQDDNLHPTVEAQAKILDHVWPALQPLLRARR
ncbi:arylesterase [Luteimonas deserti]|nr:arylesterase [Luteimonas deserti]